MISSPKKENKRKFVMIGRALEMQGKRFLLDKVTEYLRGYRVFTGLPSIFGITEYFRGYRVFSGLPSIFEVTEYFRGYRVFSRVSYTFLNLDTDNAREDIFCRLLQ